MTSNKKPGHEYSKWTEEGTVSCSSGFAVPRNGSPILFFPNRSSRSILIRFNVMATKKDLIKIFEKFLQSGIDFE